MTFAVRPAISLLTAAWLAAGAMAWGASPGTSDSRPEYIFHLRNGSQVQTSRYWEEGNQYRLERFGGVIGLDKADVVRIERIQPGSTPGTRELGPEPFARITATIWAYLADLVKWTRARAARLWALGKARVTSILAQGVATLARVSRLREGRAPLLALLATAVAVPILVYGGKRLGSWLFSDLRP